MAKELEPLPEGAVVVAEPAADVEFAVLGFEIVDQLPAFFRTVPNVRVVQALSAGMDWLMPYVPPGVIACRAVGVHDGPVSEWVLAAILAIQRRLPGFIDAQRVARWDRTPAEGMTIRDLEGQTVVVLGYGSIGRALAARLGPFGVRVIGVARQARDGAEPISALPGLPHAADVVVDLLPLIPETERFVNPKFLAHMKPGALFVNAGRGLTVDTVALLDALRSGHVCAALDVTDPEPLPPDHPLWRAPNTLITPHVAGATKRWFPRGYRFAGDQLRRYAAGQPLLGAETDRTRARNV